MTVPTASLLNAEGVYSIALSCCPCTPGLSFKFVLCLGGQALVRRHFGESGTKLVSLGFANVRPISALIAALDTDKEGGAMRVIEDVASHLRQPDIPRSPAVVTLEFMFRQILNETYSQFLLSDTKSPA